MAKILSFEYTAVGSVSCPKPYITKANTTKAYSYQDLVAKMAAWTADIRYYTEGVNSSQDKDVYTAGYTKDLVWPEIRWRITRKEITI